MRCKSQQTEFLNAVAHRCQPFASLIWQIPGACSAAKQAASSRVVCVPWDQPPHNVYLTIAHCFHLNTFPSVDYTSCRAPCTWQRRITIRKWPSLLSLSINLKPSLSSNKRKISLVHLLRRSYGIWIRGEGLEGGEMWTEGGKKKGKNFVQCISVIPRSDVVPAYLT